MIRQNSVSYTHLIMTTEYPDMVVGAGTILTTDQVDRAIAAGAKFIVSPGLDPKIVTYCIEKNIPVSYTHLDVYKRHVII